VIFYTDSVVIGASLGAAAITPYAIAGSLIMKGRDVVALGTDTLYPAASRMDGLRDRAGINNLYAVCTTLALFLGLPLCLGFLFLGRQFITLWMGSDYAFSATVLAVLTIPQFTSLPQYASSLVLAGMARHKPLAFIAIAEGVANLALSIILVRRIGVIGVAWGTVIPHLVTTAIVIPAYTLRVLNLGIVEFVRKAVIRPVLCAIPVGALCYAFSRTIPRVTWPMFGAEVAAVICVLALMAYFVSLNPKQRLALRGKLTRPALAKNYANQA
jgi:O-antigen/teichoic acid export membrane protein